MNSTMSRRVHEDELDPRGDAVALNGELFSGVGFLSFDASEKVEYETSYLNGFRDGYRRRFNEDGSLDYEASYRQGLKHGDEFHWFQGGAVKVHARYEYGIETESSVWRADGSLESRYEVSVESPIYKLLMERRLEWAWN